ncbi:MAG: orotidine-5'-phosphate decarboxylase [Candidatus Kapabacteria bacterium]|nr:orotidine-5'-phosphate decarboxylase [Ignavibacteriota bacterium]MCW5886333.1 orotidine-5'-phosphate decarboxylase [Candidatus Kapabacteria bacterium]
MNSFEKLNTIQENTNSLLCVGLDSDLNKIPVHLGKSIESILEFNKQIIDATIKYASSYKLNFAFYEVYGSEGFDILKKTIEYIGNERFVIADSKRGDIGNTSDAYAKSCFEYFKADAITVAPYMGRDSIEPFLKYEDKMTFVLALTSNPGSGDFQRLEFEGKPLYQHVIEKTCSWGRKENLGFVTGATHPDDIHNIRKIIPESYLLIPGVGTQGGNIAELMNANSGGPCIINVSRDIIYADNGADFLKAARNKAKFYRDAFIIDKIS